jgi:hypothetical protein
MSDNPFSSQRLTTVAIDDLTEIAADDGHVMISTKILFYLAKDDKEPVEPSGAVSVTLQLDDQLSLRDARFALLERALLLLRRLGAETPESLNSAWERTWQNARDEIHDAGG